ncbi:lysine-sensitive aspartokinase 3 [Psychrobium sp. 1_MG-2023]|uniref:lysine-sensitive aspartokinase 3 n=1 Tax=Psychrobium sp. 1_MG-2023 TaxID=3062624 RepID=UPI000C34B27E|nr:lysine-sensitive aspartokinase 3 [Psychrobium sp. 1_MG-2023]MDP2561842.1 lysine-sensitive aspartokinase 3 [Psychrobium sp. 1_MG-2023]PKF55787.1 lysine-sensitive aspartokinase 3 [Alteromonadales bacterium alter-6D02]
MNQSNIAKFGGTSLADFAAMQRCADVVLSDPNTRLVVVSASSGVTNLLVALSHGTLSEVDRLQALDDIAQIQQRIVEHLALSNEVLERVRHLLVQMNDTSLAIANGPSAALTDKLLSFGERLSSTLFSQVLIARGAQSVCFDVRDVLKTDGQHGKAIPQVDDIAPLVEERLQPLLNDNIVVTQGFIGSNSQGETTTLGRGGSDYSAALLGEAINAAQINIWTDVTGIFTTDPRITNQAYALEEISFNEAAEMATFGAKVLHPSTLIPAMRKNIPVFVGSSRDPQAGGTIVRNETESKPVYRAIALRREQTLLTVTSMDMLHAPGFLARVFTILAKYNLSVDLVTTSEISVALTLDNTGSNSSGQHQLSDELLAELREVCQVTIENGLALVALIGNGIDSSYGVGTRLFSTLEDVNVRMICQGASSHNLCFLVDEEVAASVVSRLHSSMFENNREGVA